MYSQKQTAPNWTLPPYLTPLAIQKNKGRRLPPSLRMVHNWPALDLHAHKTQRRRKLPTRRPLTFRQFVDMVNPRYVWYRYCVILAEALQRVADGQCTRLMVFMPPRHGKSELVSRLFTAYYLYRNPDKWVGMNCYSAELAYGMSRNARENYQRAGADLSGDAFASRHWETGYGGGMWAAGVGGSITGKGFHLGIIDDPLKNAEAAQSAIIRNKQKDWLGSTFATREEPAGAIIVVQTRWHNDDVAGYWLGMEEDEPERWHIVRFEAIKGDVDGDAIPPTCTLEPDFRQPGEALCPERYSLAKLRKMERRIGAYYFGALFQQRPQPAAGAIFKRDWWDKEATRYDGADRAVRNRVLARWIVYDTALKDGATNDYSAAAVWELWPDYRLAIRHMWNERIQSALLPERMEADAVEWNKDGKLRGLVIEDKGSGTNAIQTLRMAAPAWLADMIFEFMPTGTKEYRARLASIWCERGCVLLPTPSIANGNWYNTLLDPGQGQLWLFPYAAHDDMVDTISSGIMYLEHYIKEGWDLRQSVAA